MKKKSESFRPTNFKRKTVGNFWRLSITRSFFSQKLRAYEKSRIFNFHLDFEMRGESRKCSLLVTVTLLSLVALVSLVRHHNTPSPLS